MNLEVRTRLRRFTRLALGHSKKPVNLGAAFAVFAAHHNYCKVFPATRLTPAMALGVVGRRWTVSDLVGLTL